MATETNTKTEVNVSASAKVVALIVAVVSAAVNVSSRKRQLAEGIRAEADRQGYDKKQASQMVALSWLNAYKMADAPEVKRNAFLLKSRPDVSKVIALAYPSKPAELAAAFAHNDRLKDAPKTERIGENSLLEIARGNLTAKQAIAGKAATKRPSKLDGVLTPEERFRNSVAGVFQLHRIGENGRLTVEQARAEFETALTAYVGKATESTTIRTK